MKPILRLNIFYIRRNGDTVSRELNMWLHFLGTRIGIKVVVSIQAVSTRGTIVDEMLLHIKFSDYDICNASPNKLKEVCMNITYNVSFIIL